MGHSSFFRYAVTRPYPNRWITPVVIIGLIIFTILFSLLNFVTTGYTLVAQETSNPNRTISDTVWKRHWPSWITENVQPKCSAADISVGSKLFTNQTALKYTLTDVWRPSTGGAGGAGTADGITPTLSYNDNILENCTVNFIDIDISSADRTATQYAYAQYGAVVHTYATCSIVSPNGTLNVNLTQEYDYVPPGVSFANMYQFLGTGFLSRNKTERSSLYWGESIMSMYWANTTNAMQRIRANQTGDGNAGISKGMLYFYPNDNEQIDNITLPNFFNVDYRFLVDEGQGNITVIRPETYGSHEDFTSVPYLLENQTYPNIWESADILAKAAYSTVLTDLGHVNSTTNMLLHEDYVRYFTSNFSEIKRNIENAYPGPSERSYAAERSGPLGTTPSVFATRYVCSVPERKPAGSIFVSVLVADLVMLQAVWFLFTSAIDLFSLRSKSGAYHCQGCSKQPLIMNGEYREVAGGYRDVTGMSVPESKAPDDQVELGGLRPARQRARDSDASHHRSISEHRLLNPVSMDIGRG
ncbi:hypothetical protein KC363_g5697 [Hortaea werneckii]|uniref:Uncharacterized protein n=1 Tax=Hortaea werneckii TaxID=91943 RepID=A0A3M7FIW1_HORWE|nr:hypothetical protein KC363_g5697 [Hortaea werneckii]RMY88763.1 hypothetical protein D0861_04633 [Hortaea werneckii]